MAFKKEKKTQKDVVNERLDNINLKRLPEVDLRGKLDATLPPIRINKEVKDYLEGHFKEKGTYLSNGIREVIYEYLKKIL